MIPSHTKHPHIHKIMSRVVLALALGASTLIHLSSACSNLLIAKGAASGANTRIAYAADGKRNTLFAYAFTRPPQTQPCTETSPTGQLGTGTPPLTSARCVYQCIKHAAEGPHTHAPFADLLVGLWKPLGSHPTGRAHLQCDWQHQREGPDHWRDHLRWPDPPQCAPSVQRNLWMHRLRTAHLGHPRARCECP